MQGEGATPLGKVVRILNNQLQALSALDDRTEALDARTKHLPRGAQLSFGHNCQAAALHAVNASRKIC